MGRIELCLGGCRSGKSRFALDRAEKISHARSKVFLATAQAKDQEMSARIQRHQLERGSHWQTWEEPIHIGERIAQELIPSVIVLDCLTLWVTNLLLKERSSEAILEQCRELIEVLKASSHHTIIVSNEVGMGLVPEYPLGRQFRDVIGRCHQDLGQVADEVFFSAAGITIPMKKLSRQLEDDLS